MRFILTKRSRVALVLFCIFVVVFSATLYTLYSKNEVLKSNKILLDQTFSSEKNSAQTEFPLTFDQENGWGFRAVVESFSYETLNFGEFQVIGTLKVLFYDKSQRVQSLRLPLSIYKPSTREFLFMVPTDEIKILNKAPHPNFAKSIYRQLGIEESKVINIRMGNTQVNLGTEREKFLLPLLSDLKMSEEFSVFSQAGDSGSFTQNILMPYFYLLRIE